QQREGDDGHTQQDHHRLRQPADRVDSHQRLRSCGSMASRKVSPTRLKASEVSRIAAPGNATSHGASRKYDWLSLIVPPQLGVGGRTPTPRNDSDASNITVVDTPSVPHTSRIGSRCGNRCFQKIRQVGTPSARAASINSRWLVDSTWLYMIRAIHTQFTMAMTMATIHRLGRRIAARAMPRISAGNAIIISVSRMKTVLTKPRKYPAAAPNSVPIVNAAALARTPISSETRAPQIRRVSRSRPSRAVPRQ